MANKNFGQFTQDVAPTTSQFVIGYNTAVSGGERRFALSDILGLFRTQVFSTANGILQANGSGSVSAISIGTSLSFSAGTLNTIQDLRTADSPTFAGLTLSSALTVPNGGTGAATFTANALLLGNTTSAILSSDITYSTPTLSVPASFGITGAGSLAFTAGGANQNITLTPSGTGNIEALLNSQTPAFVSGLQGLRVTGPNSVGAGLVLQSFAAAPQMVILRAQGTSALPSALTSGVTMFSLNVRGYGATAYSGSNSAINFLTAEAWTDSAQGSLISFSTVPAGSTSPNTRVRILDSGALVAGFSSVNVPAWGTSGIVFRTNSSTWTDTSSTGTVATATAVANSFAVPTFNSTNAGVVFTNIANLYVAGDAVATGNASATNGYGIWNVGKTKLDKPLVCTPTALSYASPTSVDVTLSSVYTVTTVNATGSVTFNATSGGIAGQEMTIIITNDATSAKTITFGSNFKSTGTLTASAASRQTTISFRSDGTNFLETGRSVLTS